MNDTTKRIGRPPLPDSERKGERVIFRLPAGLRAKLDRLGGAAWLREQIEGAHEPPAQRP
ncbi:MAG: hypothetical protein MUE62_06365 [Burkholderiaceae bacterium]|jgi:hypothetical protein|nr:hypothetical protein [Burkholderiaceae bacterium]